MKTLEIWTDHDIENPSNNDGAWKIYIFDRRSTAYVSPEKFFTEKGAIRFEYQSKYRNGLMFTLDLYRHSGDVWSISGTGISCRWDTSHCAGVAVWEESPKNMGAKTIEDRTRDLKNFLETYNAWVNGDGVGFTVSDEENGIDESIGGFYGEEDLMGCVRVEYPEFAELTPTRTY